MRDKRDKISPSEAKKKRCFKKKLKKKKQTPREPTQGGGKLFKQ